MGTTALNFFISYSHAEAEDRALAKWLHEALLRADHQSFIDAGIPLGAKWSEEIERNLKACDCLIALLSEAAVNSEMVIEEVRRAHSLGRQLIPVLVRFDGDFGYHLGAIINPLQWERWESKKDSEPILQKILRLAGGSASPQPASQPAKRRAAKSPRKDAPPHPSPMASPVPGGALETVNPFYIKRRVEKHVVDRIFDYEYRRDFFTTLRSWHNDRAASKKTWGRVGLVMVISTERNLLIDNATLSPFSIGLHARLQPLDLKECLRLNARFEKLAGKSLSENDLGRLWELLRGQPYLTHEAIHAVVTRRISSVKRLVETAADDDGPFADHLRSLLKRISQRSDYNLTAVFKRIIENDPPNDQQAIGRLQAAGLARIEKGNPVPANQLYLRYFGRVL